MNPTPASADPVDPMLHADCTALQRLRNGLSTVLLWFAVALLVVMTALVLYQVFTRYVLGTPAAFTEELVRYALIWVSFIAATYAFLQRDHMALVLVVDRFPARARRGIRFGTDVLVLVLAVLVLMVGGTMMAWDSRDNISALLGISRGAVYLISPIAGAGIALAQVLNILDDLRSPSSTSQKGAE